MADTTCCSTSCDSSRIARLEDKVSRMRFWITLGALLIVAVMAFAAGAAFGRCCAMRGGQGKGAPPCPPGQPCPVGMNCGPQGAMNCGPAMNCAPAMACPSGPSSPQPMGCFNIAIPGGDGAAACMPQGGPQSGVFNFGGPGMQGQMKVIELRGNGAMIMDDESDDDDDDADDDEDGDEATQTRRVEVRVVAPTPPAPPPAP